MVCIGVLKAGVESKIFLRDYKLTFVQFHFR